jgi:hypothetical protein
LRYGTFVGRDVIMDDEGGKETGNNEEKEITDEGKETEDEDEEKKGACSGESVGIVVK